MTLPSFTAIVVNYRTGHLLPACLASLQTQNLNPEIVVVDTSCDSTEHEHLAALAEERGFRIIVLDRNVGYGGAVNAGVRIARGEYLMCMNADVRLTAGAGEALLGGIRETGAWLAGPRFYWDEGRSFCLPPSQPVTFVEDSLALWAGRIARIGRLRVRRWRRMEEKFWNADAVVSQGMISGACFVADRRALTEAGELFDSQYFLYYEDTDLCRRVVNRGGRIVMVPKAEAIHFYDQSPESSAWKEAAMATSAERFRHAYTPVQRWLLRKQRNLGFSLSHGREKARYSDLGVFSDTSPGIELPAPGDKRLRLGFDPLLIPSAGTVVTGEGYTFPVAFWNRLRPGRYFLGAFDMSDGFQLGLWSWVKHGPEADIEDHGV